MNTNALVMRMVEAVNAASPVEKAPPGFVSRKDIQDATNCSESTALRLIKRMEKQKTFKKVPVKVNGKVVYYYNV